MRLDRVAKGFIQSGLENLKGCKDCTASLGNLFQGSIVLTIKKLFPVSIKNSVGLITIRSMFLLLEILFPMQDLISQGR